MKKTMILTSAVIIALCFGGCVKYESVRETTATSGAETTVAVTNEAGETVETTKKVPDGLPDPMDTEEGELKHLYEVANDPEAKSYESVRVNYIFPSADDGSRKMGDVFAYYSLMGTTFNSSDEVLDAFVEKYMPELKPYMEYAEPAEEGVDNAVSVPIPDHGLILWVDDELQGVTAIFTSNS